MFSIPARYETGEKEMKQSIKFISIAAVLTANVLLSGGCGKEEGGIEQTGAKGQEIVEVQAEDIPIILGESQEGNENRDPVMRSYSEEERERMEALKQSYESEEAYPENPVSEVDSKDAVTEGELCYIRSTGEFYLPDRNLTDEELLEIIDCNFRIALGSNHKTQEEYEEEDRQKRAMLEEKVQAAGGISEEEAIEIGRKAMAADLGEKGENMKLRTYDENQGWSTDLCVADWSEIREQDRGAVAYSMQFDLGDDAEEWTDYHCTVNAADGSILEAYQIEIMPAGDGYDFHTVYFEH